MGSVGVPIKLLHEAVGHVVTVEMNSGEVFRGTLAQAEDSMNCQLTNVLRTSRTGQTQELEHAFIRGSKIRLCVLPDILKNAPMFRRVAEKGKGKGIVPGASAAGGGRGTSGGMQRGGGQFGAARGRGGGGRGFRRG